MTFNLLVIVLFLNIDLCLTLNTIDINVGMARVQKKKKNLVNSSSHAVWLFILLHVDVGSLDNSFLARWRDKYINEMN